MDKEKPAVALPHRTPAAPTSPAAVSYARGVAARTGQAPVVKYAQPRAGGPGPAIPPLDGPPMEGRTMAEQAAAQRRTAPAPGSIIQSQAPSSSGLDIRPQDLLPAPAQQDPDFQSGMASMYAASQPHLAGKYGVIRGGNHIPPQQLRRSPPGAPQQKAQLSEETIRGLEEINRATKQGERLVDPDGVASDKVDPNSLAGRAASLGTGSNPDDGPIPKRAPTEAEIKERLGKMDEFDLETVTQAFIKDLINNEEQRTIVEARLKPLSLSDLVMTYTVRQVVPIIPGVFEPEFESLLTDDDLHLKRMIVQEAKTLQVGDRYLMDKYSIMGLACGLFAINGKPFGPHRGPDGEFDEELLMAKFKKVVRMPLPMIAALGPHFSWFDQRVRKLFVATNIKNG